MSAREPVPALEPEPVPSESSAVATQFANPTAAIRGWASQYGRRLLISDLVIIAAAVFGSQLFWFGLSAPPVQVIPDDVTSPLSYFSFSVILIAAWMLALAAYDTRDRRVVGIGSMEYKRIFDASMRLFGLLAITAVLLQLDLARGYIVTAFPVGMVLLVASRWAWRRWLVRQRHAHKFSSRALLVGSVASVTDIADLLARYPFAGYLAVGACIPGSERSSNPTVYDLPVVGGLGEVAESAKALNADTVILTSSDHLPPMMVKRIGWSLESTKVDLIVAPALLDTAGPRIHTRPFAGLPLIHVEVPRYEGSKQAAKATFDFAAALFGVILISPILLVIAILVKTTSEGPVFFRQVRVGLNGQLFLMMKFRTMVVDAESRLEGLKDLNEGSGPLFKLRDDPRVTRVGSFLRRYSLDELPQFFNVLSGSMSIVGPRPPLVSEVEQYEPDVKRRLLVKPGITGPWQINGRSDLKWEDGVRLDLYYVENWTLTGDVILIWRTVKAVFENRGAY